jgi:quinol monooxygenase YgiN
MLVVHVLVQVKPESTTDFIAATRANAEASLREAGVARFDVVQQQDDPCRFVLIEAYRTESAPAEHKATAHYIAWRDAVAPLMATPRQSVRYTSIHLPD